MYWRNIWIGGMCGQNQLNLQYLQTISEGGQTKFIIDIKPFISDYFNYSNQSGEIKVCSRSEMSYMSLQVKNLNYKF